ncbi:MAG: hypothetical protein EOP04_05365 [Proteobacteria bacterium]|nr:MAG: hypothetical protein EOP04_05365 [Pseudomonadota bacterium]
MNLFRTTFFIALLLGSTSARASLRGESPTVIGDARQIGLSGASLTEPDSVHVSMENPANAFFDAWAASMALLNGKVRDNRMNGDGIYRRSEGSGLVASSRAFGLFVAHRLPSQEAARLGKTELQETHIGGGFPIGRLVIGGALIFARADWQGFGLPNDKATNWSANFGLRYVFSENFRVGLAGRPTLPIQRKAHSDYKSIVEMPAHIMLGASYFVNRRTAAHFTLMVFGQQTDTVTLEDPTRPSARAVAFQPRLGGEYEVYQKGITTFSVYAGTYLEPARVEGMRSRFHRTGGAGLKVWAGRASFAIDRASGYKNMIATVGVDILDLLVKIKVIPVPTEPEQPR